MKWLKENWFKVTFLIICLLFISFLYYFQKNGVKIETQNSPETEFVNKPTNKVTVQNKLSLSESEKETLLKSVDDYMNEYKLPKGVQNSYEVVIDSRLNDSIKVLINPNDKYSDSKNIIYARKINNIWTVDPKAGPWCTLEDFDSWGCY